MTRWKIALPILLIAAALCAIPIVRSRSSKPPRLSYSELVQGLDARRFSSLEIVPGEKVYAVTRTNRKFEITFPADPNALVQRAEKSGATVTFDAAPAQDPAQEVGWVILEILIFGGVFYLLFLNVRPGGSSNVGRKVTSSATTFQDVAGTQGAEEELKELVDFLRQPARFLAIGARVPKGVLLVGPPGTGKTLLARAVAGEAGVPFFHLSGSEVTGFIVGLGAHRVKTLFKRARRKGGVIFIDELDALGGTRGKNRSHNEDDRTLNQLLVEMDGFSPSEGVVVLAATNRADALDPALKRPGRFDRTVTVGLPAVDGRADILRLHARNRNVPIGGDVDFARLARLTPGTSGAELANLLNEAAIAAVREQSDIVQWRHFEIARDRMLLGKERVGFRARDEEWRIVAYHEAGHAIAGVIACPEDGLHKITIQPRGQAMGVAFFSPEDDRHLHSRRYLKAQVIKGLGGRVAEELVFGSEAITSGAESDLVQVNRIARKMIYRLGMGSQSGLLVYDEDAGSLSSQTQAEMDSEVRVMLNDLYAETRTIIEQNRAALDALANALLERETLDGSEALSILAQFGVTVQG